MLLRHHGYVNKHSCQFWQVHDHLAEEGTRTELGRPDSTKLAFTNVVNLMCKYYYLHLCTPRYLEQNWRLAHTYTLLFCVMKRHAQGTNVRA